MLSAQQKEIITATLAPFRPTNIGIFGSFARGDNRKGSDLDILVEFEEQLNLLDLVGLEQTLEELLGMEVDLVTKGSVSPLLAPYIEKDIIPLS